MVDLRARADDLEEERRVGVDLLDRQSQPAVGQCLNLILAPGDGHALHPPQGGTSIRGALPGLPRHLVRPSSNRSVPVGVVVRLECGYGQTSVCGICGIVQVGGEPRLVVPPDVLDRMTDAMTHRGPNDRGTHLAGRRRTRRPAAQHRRRRGRPPAVRERGRRRSGRSRTASSTTTLSSAAICRRRATASEPLRHRGAAAPLREATAATFPERPSRHVRRSRSGTAAAPRRSSPATGSASSRSTTPGRRPRRVRLGAEEPARERPRRGRARLRGDRRYLTLGFFAGAA